MAKHKQRERVKITAADVGKVPADLLAGPGVVAAVGSSGGAGGVKSDLAKRVEKAMQDAIVQATADGLRPNEDAAEIKKRMMDARQKIRDEG